MGILRGRAVQGGGTDTVEMTSRGGEGVVTAVASALALVFSAYSLYETALRRPDLRAFVPPVVRYSQPYNSNFEVFEVPVTVVNLGARAGTVLSMDLDVTNPRTKTTRKFYSSDFGRWTMDNANALAFRPFAPISLPGKASSSDCVLFYSRDDQKDQTIAEQKGGNLTFTLSLNTAFPEELGLLDRIWTVRPEPVAFEMEVPEIDHRTFNTGTLQLHSPHWQVGSASSSGEVVPTKPVASKTVSGETKPGSGQVDEAGAPDIATACEGAAGQTITKAGVDLKTGKSWSHEYVCP